jgi:TonB-dependent SusC/RagA subfamily outer membrane receptor
VRLQGSCNPSGQPGADATVKIRGIGSVNNSDPLYVVDGVPFIGNLSSINFSDIASTTVLKMLLTSIYGSRGANGVILITTKTGKAGASYIQVETRI